MFPTTPRLHSPFLLQYKCCFLHFTIRFHQSKKRSWVMTRENNTLLTYPLSHLWCFVQPCPPIKSLLNHSTLFPARRQVIFANASYTLYRHSNRFWCFLHPPPPVDSSLMLCIVPPSPNWCNLYISPHPESRLWCLFCILHATTLQLESSWTNLHPL